MPVRPWHGLMGEGRVLVLQIFFRKDTSKGQLYIMAFRVLKTLQHRNGMDAGALGGSFVFCLNQKPILILRVKLWIDDEDIFLNLIATLQSWGGAEWAHWSQYSSQEYQNKEYQNRPKEYQDKESQPPKYYHPKEFQLKEGSSKYHPTKDYQRKSFPPKLQQNYHFKEYSNPPNQDCQSRINHLYPPSRNDQGHVDSAGNPNAFHRQTHGPAKYEECLKKQERHFFDFSEGQRTGMDVIGSQVHFIKAPLTCPLSFMPLFRTACPTSQTLASTV